MKALGPHANDVRSTWYAARSAEVPRTARAGAASFLPLAGLVARRERHRDCDERSRERTFFSEVLLSFAQAGAGALVVGSRRRPPCPWSRPLPRQPAALSSRTA